MKSISSVDMCTRMLMFGLAVWNEASLEPSQLDTTVGSTEMCRWCSVLSAISEKAAPSRSIASVTFGASCRPAAVSRTSRGRRTKSGVPMRSSKIRIW
ncbi:hypothetical protein FQZ97_1105180 [compost metagenome]